MQVRTPSSGSLSKLAYQLSFTILMIFCSSGHRTPLSVLRHYRSCSTRLMSWVYQIALDKLEGPTTVLTFLGLELDSRLLEVRLPAVKLAELHVLISSWLGRRACTRKELESLVGHLGFACKVVQPGKTFLRHMFELLSVPKSACSFIRLNVSFRSDLLWWHTFLAPLNGINLTRTLAPLNFQVRFASDASGT